MILTFSDGRVYIYSKVGKAQEYLGQKWKSEVSDDREIDWSMEMRSYCTECQNVNVVVAQEEGRGTSVSWSEPVTPRTYTCKRAYARPRNTYDPRFYQGLSPNPFYHLQHCSGCRSEILEHRIYILGTFDNLLRLCLIKSFVLWNATNWLTNLPEVLRKACIWVKILKQSPS